MATEPRRGVEAEVLLNLVLWALGLALVATGYARARGPWARYRALSEEDANVSRYDAWRGGVRDASHDGRVGRRCSCYRQQARVGATIAAVGVVLFVLGFLLK